MDLSLSSSLDASVDVPTLHVLYVQQHPSNLLTRPYPAFVPTTSSVGDALAGKGKERAVSEHKPEEVRTQLIEWIAEEALGGDLDAAEWVLLACIARV